MPSLICCWNSVAAKYGDPVAVQREVGREVAARLPHLFLAQRERDFARSRRVHLELPRETLRRPRGTAARGLEFAIRALHRVAAGDAEARA